MLDDINLIESLRTPAALFERVAQNSFILLRFNRFFKAQYPACVDGDSIEELFCAPDLERLRSCFRAWATRNDSGAVELVVSGWRNSLIRIDNNLNAAERVLFLGVPSVGSGNTDATAGSMHHQMHNRFAAIIDYAHDGVVTIDEGQNILLMNRSALEMFGYNQTDIDNLSVHDLVPQRLRDNHPGYITNFRDSPEQSRTMYARAPVMGVRRDGSEFPCEISIAKVEQPDGCEMVAMIRDLSPESEAADSSALPAGKDKLTGLHDGCAMTALLSDELVRARYYGDPLVLFCLQVESFERLQEEQGQVAADTVLLTCAAHLREFVGRPERVAYLGGGNFVVLLPRCALDEGRLRAIELCKEVHNQTLQLLTGDHIRVSCRGWGAELSRFTQDAGEMIQRLPVECEQVGSGEMMFVADAFT